LSSTTEPARGPDGLQGEGGQALAAFALILTTLLAGAALAFDAGAMILERRAQQNAADAAAIAGARYVDTDTAKARSAAAQIAAANGFVDGQNGTRLNVSTPPVTGPFGGREDYIEVEIASTRPSIFAGVIGLASSSVSVRAVATNADSGGGPFSILALDPSVCDAMIVSGNGSLVAYGNIQVNSNCTNGALRRQGGGNIVVDVPGGACNVTGTIRDGGGQGLIVCLKNEGAPVLPDPLAKLPVPAVPDLPQAIERVTGTLSIPTGCPGATNPATLASPNLCQFSSSYAGTSWRLFPGLYPGGLKLQGGTFYFEPGIYYIGGGGLDITGTGTNSMTVESGETTGPGGGIMFYNTSLTNSAAGPISLNGSSAIINLLPLDDGTRYDGLLLFQDRSLDINGDDMTINGSGGTMSVRGTIYVKAGNVKVNGGAGTLIMDQIISRTYDVQGSSGSQIKVLKDTEYTVRLLVAGLVE
jgi:hypothetical protein